MPDKQSIREEQEKVTLRSSDLEGQAPLEELRETPEESQEQRSAEARGNEHAGDRSAGREETVKPAPKLNIQATVKTRKSKQPPADKLHEFPKFGIIVDALKHLANAYMATLWIFVLGGSLFLIWNIAPFGNGNPLVLWFIGLVSICLVPLTIGAVYSFISALADVFVCVGNHQSAEQFERLRHFLTERFVPLLPLTKAAKVCRDIRLADLLLWDKKTQEADKIYAKIAVYPPYTWRHAARAIQPAWFADWLRAHHRDEDANHWLRIKRLSALTLIPVALCQIIGLAIVSYQCQVVWDVLSCVIYRQNSQISSAAQSLRNFCDHVELVCGDVPKMLGTEACLAKYVYSDRSVASNATPYLVRYLESVKKRAPDSLVSRAELTEAYSMLGSWQAFAREPKAQESLQNAVSAAESVYGPHSPRVIRPLLVLAKYLQKTEHSALAESALNRAMAIANRKKVWTSERAQILCALVDHSISNGDLGKAELFANEAVALSKSARGKSQLDANDTDQSLYKCNLQLASILERTGRIELAKSSYADTIQNLETARNNCAEAFPHALMEIEVTARASLAVQYLKEAKLKDASRLVNEILKSDDVNHAASPESADSLESLATLLESKAMKTEASSIRGLLKVIKSNQLLSSSSEIDR